MSAGHSRWSNNLRTDTHNDSVVPGEDREFIQACNKVPARGDVAGQEDAKSQDGDGVHGADGSRPAGNADDSAHG